MCPFLLVQTANLDGVDYQCVTAYSDSLGSPKLVVFNLFALLHCHLCGRRQEASGRDEIKLKINRSCSGGTSPFRASPQNVRPAFSNAVLPTPGSQSCKIICRAKTPKMAMHDKCMEIGIGGGLIPPIFDGNEIGTPAF